MKSAAFAALGLRGYDVGRAEGGASATRVVLHAQVELALFAFRLSYFGLARLRALRSPCPVKGRFVEIDCRVARNLR